MGNQHAIYFCGGILHASVMVMVVDDKGVTLHVTLFSDVMVDVFIFIVMLGIGGIALIIVQWYYSVSLVAVCDCCDKQCVH